MWLQVRRAHGAEPAPLEAHFEPGVPRPSGADGRRLQAPRPAARRADQQVHLRVGAGGGRARADDGGDARGAGRQRPGGPPPPPRVEAASSWSRASSWAACRSCWGRPSARRRGSGGARSRASAAWTGGYFVVNGTGVVLTTERPPDNYEWCRQRVAAGGQIKSIPSGCCQRPRACDQGRARRLGGGAARLPAAGPAEHPDLHGHARARRARRPRDPRRAPARARARGGARAGGPAAPGLDPRRRPADGGGGRRGHRLPRLLLRRVRRPGAPHRRAAARARPGPGRAGRRARARAQGARGHREAARVVPRASSCGATPAARGRGLAEGRLFLGAWSGSSPSASSPARRTTTATPS